MKKQKLVKLILRCDPFDMLALRSGYVRCKFCNGPVNQKVSTNLWEDLRHTLKCPYRAARLELSAWKCKEAEANSTD